MTIKETLEARISRERTKELLIELVKVPSPQTDKFEAEPLLAEFIRKAVEPRLREMGIVDIHYDGMNNLIATHGADQSGKSLMFISNAMNQPQSTMKNAYHGDVVDGATLELPGEVVLGKGASEQKANMAAMLHAMETAIASDLPVNGKLVFLCCVSGETGRHDAIKSVVEGEGIRTDMAILGGTSLFGGRGTLSGTLLAVLLLGTLNNGLTLMDVLPLVVTTQDCPDRVRILPACVMDSLRWMLLRSVSRPVRTENRGRAIRNSGPRRPWNVVVTVAAWAPVLKLRWWWTSLWAWIWSGIPLRIVTIRSPDQRFEGVMITILRRIRSN